MKRINNVRRNKLRSLMSLHGLKMNGLPDTTKNAMAILDRHGINYKECLEVKKECPQCKNTFDANATNGKQGRDKKYCSRECGIRATMRVSFFSHEKRPCFFCGEMFSLAEKKQGNHKFCSPDCKIGMRKKMKESLDWLIKEKSRRDKLLTKSRTKTKEKIKICKTCGTSHQRFKSWYCSDDCKTKAKIQKSKEYYRLPHVLKRKKERVLTDEQKQKRNTASSIRLKEKRMEDPLYLAKERIRSRTKAAFRGQGFTKGCATREMLGCSWDQFKCHIEKQFTKGMKWSNRELWHIDHVVPLASANSQAELERLSHFSNLRPLWATENIIKADKIIECQPELAIKL